MKNYQIEVNGKIVGKTNDLNDARFLASIYGKNAYIFCNRIAIE